MNMNLYAKVLLWIGVSITALYLFITTVVRAFLFIPQEQQKIYAVLYVLGGVIIVINSFLGMYKVGCMILDTDKKEIEHER